MTPIPTLIEVEERDPSFPLDHDGSPHTAGRTWWIAPSAIRAITSEIESERGDLVQVHLHDRKAPIPICEDLEWLLEQLGSEAGA